MLTPSQIIERADMLEARNRESQARLKDIKTVRDGNLEQLAPGLFPEKFPKSLVANFIDTAAHDVAEVLSPLPSVECLSGQMVTDSARKFADKRTRIAHGYIDHSRLDRQAYYYANNYVSFARGIWFVQPDFKAKSPCIYSEDPIGAYVEKDRLGRVKCYIRVFRRRVDELCREYESDEGTHARLVALRMYAQEDHEVDVIRYVDKDQQSLVCKDGEILLSSVANPIGRCPVVVSDRPGAGDITGKPRGQFEDVLWIQIARSQAAIYALRVMDESVNAPLLAPMDVQEFPFGPNAILRTDNPQGVGRVPIQIPNGVFAELQGFDNEMRRGARYPEGRTGNVDASIVTGEGVQALMGTFNSQVDAAQRNFAGALEEVISLCFEMDEALWPNERKTVRGRDEGAPFEVTYTPSRDIKGDWTCHVTYGMAAGLDPNRALVLFLQALGAGLISRGTARRSMPFDINISEEERAIDIETQRLALSQAIAATAQAIPMMASQGQSPEGTVLAIAKVIELRQKGKSMEDAVTEAFKPPEQPEGEARDPLAALMQQMGGGEGGGAPSGLSPGRAELGQGGSRDLLMTLAGTTPSGSPNLGAVVSRRIPA